MATIALSIAGRAAGAALGPFGAIGGGLLGGLIGSYIDQSFILPYLFPAPIVAAQRLDQIQVSHQDEGAPANFIVAGSPRVEGTVIWGSDVDAVAIKKNTGGKGGGEKRVVGYNYLWDCAVAVSIGQLSTIDRIIIEGKEIYNRSPNVTYTSSVLSVAVVSSGSATRMRINSPSGGPDLSRFRSGYDIVISGFANAANNGTFRCRGSSKDRATGASYVLLKRSSAVVESAGASVTLTQALPTFDPAKVTAITIYTGTSSQTADPLIEAQEGVGNVSGYRGTAYVVFEKLNLADYGNRAPQAFNFIVSAASANLSTAVQTIFTRTGLSSGECDVTGLSGTVGGQSISGPIGMGQAIQPLLVAFDILTQETAGSMKFIHRANARIIDVDPDDLGCVQDGGSAPYPIFVDDSADVKKPSEIIVNFHDSEKDHQPGSTGEPQGPSSSADVVTVDLPLSMTGAKARGIARRLKWLSLNSRRVSLQLPMKYADVQENDILRFMILDEVWLLLVLKMDIGQNFVIKIEAVVELSDILSQVEESDDPYDTTPTGTIAGETDGEAVEIPPINADASTNYNVPYITYGAAKHDPDDLWGGVQLFESKDDTEFFPSETLETESIRGFTQGALSGTGIVPSVFDEISTVTVVILRGELESRTALEVENGVNWALIGDEIVGFKTATLVSAGVYTLSGLLRGRRDTVDQMTTHAAGERFLLLTGGGVEQRAYPVSWIGAERFIRFVPGGGAVEDYESQSITPTGASLKPFSPAEGTLTRDGSGNITLTWHRRTRAITRIFSGITIPLLEETEAYEIDVVYPAGSGTVVRTIDATSETCPYSAAHQGDDSVTLFDDVEFRVYQISAIVGRGKALTVTG